MRVIYSICVKLYFLHLELSNSHLSYLRLVGSYFTVEHDNMA